MSDEKIYIVKREGLYINGFGEFVVNQAAAFRFTLRGGLGGETAKEFATRWSRREGARVVRLVKKVRK